MTTTDKGNLTELRVTTRLMELGKKVLKPVGDGCRYDLALDDNGRLIRIQCKTSRPYRNAIIFNTTSMYAWTRKIRRYDGDVDFFATYSEVTGKCYLVPVDKAQADRCILQISTPRNNQKARVRMAKDFEI